MTINLIIYERQNKIVFSSFPPEDIAKDNKMYCVQLRGNSLWEKIVFRNSENFPSMLSLRIDRVALFLMKGIKEAIGGGPED